MHIHNMRNPVPQGVNPAHNPPDTAIDLPPLNFKNGEKECPKITENPGNKSSQPLRPKYLAKPIGIAALRISMQITGSPSCQPLAFQLFTPPGLPSPIVRIFLRAINLVNITAQGIEEDINPIIDQKII